MRHEARASQQAQCPRMRVCPQVATGTAPYPPPLHCPLCFNTSTVHFRCLQEEHSNSRSSSSSRRRRNNRNSSRSSSGLSSNLGQSSSCSSYVCLQLLYLMKSFCLNQVKLFRPRGVIVVAPVGEVGLDLCGREGIGYGVVFFPLWFRSVSSADKPTGRKQTNSLLTSGLGSVSNRKIPCNKNNYKSVFIFTALGGGVHGHTDGYGWIQHESHLAAARRD